MYRIWFEREFPEQYGALLDGIGVLAGSASDTPNEPFAAVASAHAIVAGARLIYDAALMDLAPGLRVISRTGIGVDNVALAAATERGIVVCNAPDAPTISTAEMTITLMLAVARDLKRVGRALEAGRREDFFSTYQGLELQGLQLGLIGLGRIGGRVAQIALALGMRVGAYDPHIAAERAAVLGVALAPTLEAVLADADIVSLHVPVTPETENLMDAQRLAQMKRGALLVNTARGALVDEAALEAALDRGQLRGAGLDVLRQKPMDLPAAHPLLNRDDVIVTPHIASATAAGKDRLWRTAIAQAIQVLRGERPPHVANPGVWQKRKPPPGEV